MYFLGIDIGTTNAKACVLSEECRIVAEVSASYPLHVLGGGGVEQNPADWWQACVNMMRQLWRRGVDPSDIRCIAVSGHGASLVMIDEQGRPLRPAISSLDTRCRMQAEFIRSVSGEMILEKNGNHVGAFNFEPKLKWIKDTDPAAYEAMPSFLSAASFINYMLTGERCMNVSDAGIGMAFDRSKDTPEWSVPVILSMGLDVEKFPKVRACSEIIGTIRPEAAEATGLPSGIPVLAGGEDTSSAALSMGIIRPGIAYLSLGTQGTVGVCTDRFERRPEILGFPHVLPGLSLLNGSMSTFGAGMDWFAREWCKDLLSEAEHDPEAGNVYERLGEACRDTEPGSRNLLFLPYLSGGLHPVLDENAMGVFFGLTLGHTREHMARAVMEGSAHAVRHNLYFAEQVSGPVDELRAVGGPARSPLWCQAIADITGRRIKVMGVRNGEGGAPFGNALLAAQQHTGGHFDDMIEVCLTVQQVYEPVVQTFEMYERHHEVYRMLYSNVKHLFPALSGKS